MHAAWLALAQAAPPALWDPRLLWLTLALVAAILLGALILVWVDRWRKRTDTDQCTTNDQLANFRELYEQGQMSTEEFERVRALLSQQLRQEPDVPASASPTLPEPNPETPRPTEPGPPPA